MTGREDAFYFLFFAGHAPVISFPESSETHEYVDEHHGIWDATENFLYEIVLKSTNKSPIQTSDYDQEPRERIHGTHKEKEKG
jgi:hypothetical protein